MLKLAFLLLLSACTTMSDPKDSFLMGLFLPKTKKRVERNIFYHHWQQVDLEKSTIKIFEKYSRLMASSDSNYSIIIELKNKLGEEIFVDPKYILIDGLSGFKPQISLNDHKQYVASGVTTITPGSYILKVKVGGNYLKQSLPLNFMPMASSAYSEMKVLEKPDSHQRFYLIHVKDINGKDIDSEGLLEMYIDGEAQILAQKKVSPSQWKIKVQFFCDDCAVYFGFKIHGQFIRRFQRINFRFAEIDEFKSYIYPSKKIARADGNDKIKIFIRLLNDMGHPLFQMKDFIFDLVSSNKDIVFKGPFDNSAGTFFELSSLKEGNTKLRLKVDQINIGQEETVYFTKAPKMSLKNKWKCLKYLRSGLDPDWEVNIDSPPTDLEIEETFALFNKEFEYKSTGSPIDFENYIEKLSIIDCVAVPGFDNLREKASHEMRKIIRRKNR